MFSNCSSSSVSFANGMSNGPFWTISTSCTDGIFMVIFLETEAVISPGIGLFTPVTAS